MPGPTSPPGFSPPRWPRLSSRRDAGRPAGGLAAAVVEIPYSWISTPLTRQPTPAITAAAVTQSGGTTAHAKATDALVRQFGAGEAEATLDTAVDADAQNFAHFLVTYQAVPRPRQPVLTLNLYGRTDAECLLILSVDLAQRVRVIQAPAGTPPGALNFVVEGISHVAAVDQRLVTWATAALIGTGTTEPGPWFRLGSSSLGGTDLIPF